MYIIYWLYYIGSTENSILQNVANVLSVKVTDALMSWKPRSFKLATENFRSPLHDLTVATIFAHINVTGDATKGALCDPP